MNLRWKAVVLMSILGILAPAEGVLASVQHVPAHGGSRVISSDAVPRGELHGVVIEASDGEPIEGALVSIGGRDDLTDTLGRFAIADLDDLPEGPYDIVGQYIGFRSDTLSFQVLYRMDGLVARLVLERSYEGCGGINHPGMRVLVRDALTGVAPAGPVSIHVWGDSVSVWDVASSSPEAEFVEMLAELWPPTRDVRFAPDSPLTAEVAAVGYAPWRMSNIWLPRGRCGTEQSDVIKVWLLPTQNVGATPSNKREQLTRITF